MSNMLEEGRYYLDEDLMNYLAGGYVAAKPTLGLTGMDLGWIWLDGSKRT